VGGELKGSGTDGTREIEWWWVVNWKGVGQMGQEKLSGRGWWTEREWDRWDKRNWVVVGGELKGSGTDGTREIEWWWVVKWKGVGQMGQEKLSGGGWWNEREWDRLDKRNAPEKLKIHTKSQFETVKGRGTLGDVDLPKC